MRVIDNSELLPCPFCNKQAELTLSIAGYYIFCSAKNRKHIVEVGPYAKRITAIKLWNTRKDIDK